MGIRFSKGKLKSRAQELTNYVLCECVLCCAFHSVVSDSLRPNGQAGLQSMGILRARILEWVAMLSSRGWIFPT